MTRHSKNNTAAPIFTYHERKNVKGTFVLIFSHCICIDFNTLKQRLASDSLRKFEQCWLCLCIAINPVSTPEGYIFCKECILYSLSKQLEEYKLKKLKWEKQLQLYEQQLREKEQSEQEQLKRKILQENLCGNLNTKKSKLSHDESVKSGFKPTIDSTVLSTSFWLPNDQGKGGGFSKLDKPPVKPEKNLKCPITSKPLKLKDLITVNAEVSHEVEDDPTSPVIWLCSISKKPISHNKAILIKDTGQVVLQRFTDKLDATEFISLIPGGTGFAAHNSVEASKYRPVMGS
ncbi:bifunctional Nitric oxide synthase-interacting protein [Babesia duncani]|uniref:Bifunctional Nitric oxide synthase-interacting protein n=1 Tax=Babesia duncani TaxID=323732 RepID=A0AAD9PP27_9APIC|nr:bifunctional Nitric oxide synthase-interacting protein [Babesia duncani]